MSRVVHPVPDNTALQFPSVSQTFNQFPYQHWSDRELNLTLSLSSGPSSGPEASPFGFELGPRLPGGIGPSWHPGACGCLVKGRKCSDKDGESVFSDQ